MALRSKTFIALCSTAVSIIYAAGLSVTHPQTTDHAAAVQASTAPKSKYKDGTFTGSGTNRFGTVEVALTIAKGKIASVEITKSATRYPQRYIDSLPAEVIASQSAEIDTVSGATRSSEDFINAVLHALSNAEQAK